MDRGVLSPEEKLYGSTTINYTEKLVGRIETWKRGGVAIFTDRQVILSKGFSCEYVHIPYNCIKEVGKCNQGFFPIGLVIAYEEYLVCWGDVGIANFFISRDALKKRDFTKGAYTWDSC